MILGPSLKVRWYLECGISLLMPKQKNYLEGYAEGGELSMPEYAAKVQLAGWMENGQIGVIPPKSQGFVRRLIASLFPFNSGAKSYDIHRVKASMEEIRRANGIEED